MKKYLNGWVVSFIGFFFYTMGSTIAKIGQSRPAYVVDWELAFLTATFMLYFFFLGWMAGRKSGKETP